MVDQFDDPYEEDETLLGLSEKGPRGYRIISLQEYGKGDIDPFCRENLLKRAIRTRISDRDIEYTFGRGGDRAYLVMETGEPDISTTTQEQYVQGEEVDTQYPELKYRVEGKDKSKEQLAKIRLEEEGKYLFEKWCHFSDMLVPFTDQKLLTSDQVIGILMGRPEAVLERVIVMEKGKFEARYFVDLPNHEGQKSVQNFSAKRTETKFDRDAQGKLQVRLRPAEKALETDELSEGIPQEGRLNFHMVSKLKLNRHLARLHSQRRNHPTTRVQYPYAGCSPIGNLKSTDEISWRDAEYRRAIQLKRKNKRGLFKRQVHDLPRGLFYNTNEEEYQVVIGSLGLHGLRVIAHNRAEKKSRRAKEAYEQLMEALVDQAVRGRRENRLRAWEILAKFGKDGLETGSAMFHEAIFEREESSWIYPDDEARSRSFERRFTYDKLYAEMQTALHAAYDIDPDVTSVDQYKPFWTEVDHEVRYGDKWFTEDPKNRNIRHMHRPWIALVNDFIEASFDRSFPSEQYQYAKMLSRIFGAHDKKSYRSKAKAMQRVMELTIHVISLPTVNWVYEPDGRGSGEWKLNIDWSTFDYFAEGIEAVRDWVRMIGEWKFTKSAKNSYDAMSFESRTADSLRGNDWGGIWNPVPYWACWSFWLEHLHADSRPSVRDEHGTPMFEGDRNPDGSWIYNQNFRRVWKRRAPMPVEPVSLTDGPPKQLVGETSREWQDRLRTWNAKYVDGTPVKPVRAGESDDDWNLIELQWMDEATAWNEYVEDRWIEDIQEYNEAIKRRTVLMGWAWYDRDPSANMPHDGALRQLTAQKWADWLAMILQARGLNSNLGEGLIPDLGTFIKEQTSRVRNYDNETHLMESDEGSHHDPQAFWGYMGGVLRAHVVSIINYRLQGFRESPNFFKVLFKITDVHNETATTVRDQLNKMWENAPLEGIKRRLMRIWDDALAENVIHVRPKYNKFLEGLPDGVQERLHPMIKKLNIVSDYRVRVWAANLSSGEDGGKRAFTNATRFLEEGYGTNTGKSFHEEQKEQDKLGFTAWMNGQYDKAVWFVRAHTLETFLEVIGDAFHFQSEVIKLVRGGLSMRVTWEIIQICGGTGFLIKGKNTFPDKATFMSLAHPTEMEEKYSELLDEFLGTDELQAVLRGEVFEHLGYNR